MPCRINELGVNVPVPEELAFDQSQLAMYDPERVEELLATQRDLYLNHLRIAKSLDGWASRIDSDGDPGFAEGLQEVAAHLRQGDYCEGGEMLNV